MIRRVAFPAIAPPNGAPSGAVGIALGSAFGNISIINAEFLLQVILFIGAGSVSADLFLYGQRISEWGPQGDANGQLNGGLSVSGTTRRVYYKPLCNQSMFDRVYLEVRNPSAGLNVQANLFIGTNAPPPT